MSPFLAWGDFHALLRFARSTIPEDKWGTTRTLTPRSSGHIGRKKFAILPLLSLGVMLEPLYYYMRNFCNLIGLEQWYFS